MSRLRLYATTEACSHLRIVPEESMETDDLEAFPVGDYHLAYEGESEDDIISQARERLGARYDRRPGANTHDAYAHRVARAVIRYLDPLGAEEE